LGRGIATQLAEAGASVVVNYHQNETKAAETIREIEDHGGQAISFRGDVASEEDVDRLVVAAVSAFGGLDIMVSNSGRQKDAAIADMSLDDWRAVIDTNLTGQLLCARAAIKRFRLQGNSGRVRANGTVLCMSSVHETTHELRGLERRRRNADAHTRTRSRRRGQAAIDARALLVQAGIDAEEREAADRLQKLVLRELHSSIRCSSHLPRGVTPQPILAYHQIGVIHERCKAASGRAGRAHGADRGNLHR
jgi:hypothetical protein